MNLKKNLDRDLFVMNFVQFVSSPQTHAKRVRKIKKTMQICPANLTETQWMKLWRGFYYAIWYTEMRKGGEELIEEMGFYQNDSYLLSGFKSLTESWSGIDSFRIDKYMFLVRNMLRNILKQQISSLVEGKVLFENNIFLVEHKKSQQAKINEPKLTDNNRGKDGDVPVKNKATLEEMKQSLDIKAAVIDFIVSVTSNSVGLFLHVCDIYIDELQKSLIELELEDSSKASVYYDMLIPFGKRLSVIQDERLRRSIRMNIFDKLLDQIVIAEPISVRNEIFTKLLNPLVEIASLTDSGKNRNCLYSIADKFRSKLASLTCASKDKVKLKRKITGIDRKTKKIKYEIGTSTPFVRSIVPLPLI